MNSSRRNIQKLPLWLSVAVMGLAIFLVAQSSAASIVDDLKKSIEQKNQEIQKLEDEAKKYRAGLASNQQMGKNLKEELARIQSNVKKLQSDIELTRQQIKRTELEITKVSYEIGDKELSIRKLQTGLASLVKVFFESEQNSTIELMLRRSPFSQFFRLLDSNASIEKKVLSSLDALHTLRIRLESEKKEAQQKRDESRDLHTLLTQRQQALLTQKNERNSLLTVTKAQEKLYQQLLAEQQKKRAQLDKEIEDIEAKIRITIDISSLPSKGTGVLGWPLPDVAKQSCFSSLTAVKNCITQFFGNTEFAAAGAYAGKGHNGVDFRSDIGTSVLAAEGGIVEDTGDTDQGCRGASYGKWILIKHSNNLSTIYAHLSQINIAKGDQISRGSRIALSGKTGYATGPHLHFGLYATQGVSIQSIRSKVCGRTMTLPIAATNAYLNPLDYL